MQSRNTFTIAVYLSSALYLSSCSEDKDEAQEQVVTDPLLGNWTSSCGPLLTSQQIDTAVNPDNEDLENGLARFYFRKSYQFRKPTDSEFDSGRSTLLNRVVISLNVYKGLSDEVVTECEEADLFATQVETWEYNSEPVSLRTDLDVSEENGFPATAAAINLSSLGFSRTYHTGPMIEALNSYDICEYSDWVSGTSKNIADKRNCFESPLSLTDALIDIQSELILNQSYASETYKTEFLAGEGLYSIFAVDATTDPKALKMGIPLVDEEGTFSDAEIVDQLKQSGDSEVHRHRLLSNPYIYFGE